MDGVDKADSAQFTAEEVLNPEGWVLLSFIMDPRTGLGRYHDYRMSNYQLMEYMIEYCRTMDAEQILRHLDEIKPGNRFTVYSLFPEANVSLQVMDGKGKQNTVFACGHSVLNRTCTTNIGSLMLQYGGGGHAMVGTCQVPHE